MAQYYSEIFHPQFHLYNLFIISSILCTMYSQHLKFLISSVYHFCKFFWSFQSLLPVLKMFVYFLYSLYYLKCLGFSLLIYCLLFLMVNCFLVCSVILNCEFSITGFFSLMCGYPVQPELRSINLESNSLFFCQAIPK